MRLISPHSSLIPALVILLTAGCSGAQTDSDANNQPQADAIGDDAGGPDAIAPTGWDGLVINEVAAKGDPEDWFELFNASDEPIDLGGVFFTDDIAGEPQKGVFADGTSINPGAYLVKEMTDADPGFKLGGDEELAIIAPDGAIIDQVDWAEGDSPDGASFGRLPNGTGDFETLMPTRGSENQEAFTTTCGDGVLDQGEVCDPAADLTETCETQGFTAGELACSDDCAALDTSGCTRGSDVVINEVAAKGGDEVELYNLSSTEVDLSGWYYGDSDYPADPTQRYVIPAGTVLAAGAYIVFEKDTHHAFGLGGDDAVTLYDEEDNQIDVADWPDGEADTSYCRTPNGTGAFQPCAQASFGDPNP